MTQIFHDLNESQRQAVTTTEGPVLVVAGPGTGKTLTIVRRIAYLIQQGAKQENILAVTFTNRAAREMKGRVNALLGSGADKIFIGTFHLLGLKIIRDNLTDEFILYNRDEQTKLVKALFKDSGMNARQAADRISRIKSFTEDSYDPSESPLVEGGIINPPLKKGLGSRCREALQREAGGFSEQIKRVYGLYQSALAKNSAFDFDDLILKPIEMFGNADSCHFETLKRVQGDIADNDNALLKKYRERFKYIIVDEYQDINPAQYRLLRLLAGSDGRICAVGDPDQAIYSFRGADVEHFLNFTKDFGGARTITLTDNYRSTGVILNASGAMIKNNLKRIDKELRPAGESGSPLNIISAPDDKAEGRIIVSEIEKRIGGTSHFKLINKKAADEFSGQSYRFSDFAVIFRTNAQARAIEEAFIESGIPYQVIGKGNSIQKKELEETVSYLRSILKPENPPIPPFAKGGLTANEEKLLTAADFYDPKAEAVTLMTMHTAKGLEFKVVFIAGVEDGLIPFTLNKEDVDIEEERRLFYVGMTRAKDELFLIHARNRFIYGQRLSPSPSTFLGELPDQFVQNRVIADKIRSREKDRQIGLF
ncbi:MAG: UvrD-helicase domain-containing protein [Nitrospirae bacterium]|nr:UvrD-helicase domain-containing protein [Nitrospirota bacterium]